MHHVYATPEPTRSALICTSTSRILLPAESFLGTLVCHHLKDTSYEFWNENTVAPFSIPMYTLSTVPMIRTVGNCALRNSKTLTLL